MNQEILAHSRAILAAYRAPGIRGVDGFTPEHGVAKLPLWRSNGHFWPVRSWSWRVRRSSAQQATFKAGTSIVAVLTTVTDAQGRLVPNLEREDFTILDNGKPQEITFFQNETQPFTVVVMLDFSFSMNAQPRSAEGGGRAVHPPHAARTTRGRSARSATRFSSAARSPTTATT